MDQKKQPRFSEEIGRFCSTIDGWMKDYQWNFDEVGRLDSLTQDYLHMLELGELDYRERAKVATKIMKCRKERRESKDTVELLEPLIQFLDSEKGKNMMNLIREVLGQTRKVEKRMENRTYRYRVYDPGGKIEQGG